MSAEWLCKLGGQPCGPFTVEQLRQLAAAGTIDAATEVRRQKDPRWFLAGKVPGLLSPVAKPAAPAAAVQQGADRLLKRAAPHAPSPATVRPAIPVGSPVAKAAPGVPVGKPVSPVVVRAVAPGVPAAKVAPSSAADVFNFTTANSTDSKATKMSKPGETPARKRKSRTPLVVVASLGGVGLLAAAIGTVLVVLNTTGGSDEPVAAATQQSDTEAVVGDEANPEFVSLEANPPDRSAVALRAASPSTIRDAARHLAEIKTWNSLAKTQSQGFKNLARFEVTAVWLAADATGRRIGMKTTAAAPPAASASDANATAAPKLEAAETPEYVFAELRITNTGNKPVKYAGWNNATTPAILADQNGSPLEFVPPSATPNVTRLATTFIPPGESIDDTLVFHAPPNAVQTLRLALPRIALSPRSNGHFALEVPPEMLFEEPSPLNASGLAGGGANPALDAAQREFAALQRQLAEGESPGPAPPVPKPAEPASSPSPTPAAEMAEDKTDAKPAAAKPPTAEDLDKLFRETDSTDTSDETKPAETTDKPADAPDPEPAAAKDK